MSIRESQPLVAGPGSKDVVLRQKNRIVEDVEPTSRHAAWRPRLHASLNLHLLVCVGLAVEASVDGTSVMILLLSFGLLAQAGSIAARILAY
jgi:hypothetical protein